MVWQTMADRLDVIANILLDTVMPICLGVAFGYLWLPLHCKDTSKTVAYKLEVFAVCVFKNKFADPCIRF